jgi:hypothetical protein
LKKSSLKYSWGRTIEKKKSFVIQKYNFFHTISDSFAKNPKNTYLLGRNLI